MLELGSGISVKEICTPRLSRMGFAFFFFGSDDAMRLLFQQPQIAGLRPAGAGSSQGPTGGVGPGST